MKSEILQPQHNKNLSGGTSPLQFHMFDWLRFPLIVGIVFIHCFGKPFDIESTGNGIPTGMDLYNLTRVGISHVLTHVCVPTFFFISGYLFFIGLEKWNTKEWCRKVKKRGKTLFIPYLIWNSLSIAFNLMGHYRQRGFAGIKEFIKTNNYWHLYWDSNIMDSETTNWVGGHFSFGSSSCSTLVFA